MGDVLVVQGPASILPQTSRRTRPPAPGRANDYSRRSPPGWVALAILGATIAALAFNLLPVPVAFFCAAGAMILFGALPVREAYSAVEWPILIMFAALIPISGRAQQYKATQLIADGLSHVGAMMPHGALSSNALAAAMP